MSKHLLLIIAGIVFAGVILYEWRMKHGSPISSVLSHSYIAESPDSGDPTQPLS